MRLESFLLENKQKLLQRWFDDLLESYPPETARMLKKESNQFANPVGHAALTGMDGLLGEFRAQRGVDSHRPMVALAPGSVWFTKRWPEEHFLAVARALLHDGVPVVLVGGADDAALCARIAEGCGEGAAILNAAGRLSLLQSAELLRRCALLVSNDSAPMHLAGAVGTPVFALFGATVPSFGFAPLGPRDRVFELQGLACRPCGIHGGQECPIGTFVCMRDLTPASLLAPIGEFLSQYRAEN